MMLTLQPDPKRRKSGSIRRFSAFCLPALPPIWSEGIAFAPGPQVRYPNPRDAAGAKATTEQRALSAPAGRCEALLDQMSV